MLLAFSGSDLNSTFSPARLYLKSCNASATQDADSRIPVNGNNISLKAPFNASSGGYVSNKARIINPGSLYGGTDHSVVILNTDNDSVEKIAVSEYSV